LESSCSIDKNSLNIDFAKELGKLNNKLRLAI